MTAVEEIQAAIDKLTELRDTATPAPWKKQGGGSWGEGYEGRRPHGIIGGPTPKSEHNKFGSPFVASEIFVEVNADLIVTLHRTIDAQLAILEEGVRAAEQDAAIFEIDHALLIARAINGGTQ